MTPDTKCLEIVVRLIMYLHVIIFTPICKKKKKITLNVVPRVHVKLMGVTDDQSNGPTRKIHVNKIARSRWIYHYYSRV